MAHDDTLVAQCALFKDRCSTTLELADWVQLYHVAPIPSAEERAQHVTDAVVPALRALRERLLPLAHAVNAEVCRGLSAEDQAGLVALLRRARGNLESG